MDLYRVLGVSIFFLNIINATQIVSINIFRILLFQDFLCAN